MSDSSPGDPSDPPADETLIARRGLPDDAEQTAPARGRTSTAPPGPRRRSPEAAEAGPEVEDEPDDGSTMVARRESRRRAARAGESPEQPATADPPTTERIASTPTPDRPIYRPRAPEPVQVVRAASSPRSAQRPVDSSAIEAASRARARRRALLVAVAASVVLAVAVAALVLLTITG